MLDALRDGDFGKAVPIQLRAAFPKFLEEAKEPLLLPAVVENTIDRSIRERHDAWFLIGWMRPTSWPRRLLAWLTKWFIRLNFGTNEKIADRAVKAILTQGELERHQVAERVLNYSARGADHRLMLLAMGKDAAKGHLVYDPEKKTFVADLDLYRLGPRYADEEQLMTDIAKNLGGELRSSPAWAFMGKPISVHNQGGCPMSADENGGVTDPNGKVWGCEGLYVLDGSTLCTSVGVNPAATIAAIAERNVRQFIQGKYPHWPQGNSEPGAKEYASQLAASAGWGEKKKEIGWKISPPENGQSTPIQAKPLGLMFSESMQGYYSETLVDPADDAAYRQLEILGRPHLPLKVDLDVGVENLALFFEDETHMLKLRGKVTLVLPGEASPRECAAHGTLQLFVPRYKPYGITHERRMKAQRRFDRKYRTLKGVPPKDDERVMTYHLMFAVDGVDLHLIGYKRIRDDAGIDAWRDTSGLFFRLLSPGKDGALGLLGAGVAHVDLPGFLFSQLRSIKVGILSDGTDPTKLALDRATDPAQVVWGTTTFATFFFGELQRIYMPEVKSALETFFGLGQNNVQRD